MIRCVKSKQVIVAAVLGMAVSGAISNAEDQETLQRRFATFKPQEYRRPYGPNAPWNIPVKGLAKHPESDIWADRLWRFSTADRPGNFNLGGFEDYSYPVYAADEATRSFPVRSRHPDWGNLHGKSVPWNPNWQPAKGSNGQVIILEPGTGREWNLWQVAFDGEKLTVGNGNLVDGLLTKERIYTVVPSHQYPGAAENDTTKKAEPASAGDAADRAAPEQ